MKRLPDLINIAKCNIFANPVSFNNCFGKFSISTLLSFTIITVWVLAIVSQKFVCTLKDFKWMRSCNVIAKHIKPWYQTMHCIHTYKKKPLLSFQKMKYVALNQRGALWILYYIHNPSSIDLWQQMFLLCKANKKMKKLFWSQSFLYPSIQ